MAEGTLKVSDRHSLRLRTWEPKGAPRAVVALVHGLGEHADLYGGVAEYLNGRGFLVLAPDLFGHGRNPGVRGHASYALMDEAVDGLVGECRRRIDGGRPVFLYGHSTGASWILLWQIARPGERVAGIVASSPSLGPPDPKPSAAKQALGRLMAKVWPSFIMSNGLDLANLSRDAARADAIRSDPLFHTKVSALLGVGFLDSWRFFERWPGGTMASPVLVLQGTADRCVDPAATVAVAGRMRGDVTLKTWEGFVHLLHEEPERAEVLGLIARWMDAHLG